LSEAEVGGFDVFGQIRDHFEQVREDVICQAGHPILDVPRACRVVQNRVFEHSKNGLSDLKNIRHAAHGQSEVVV
ncbi:hypothetical protein PFISCL1PPCAC_3111, partial [Pristionchus fissidentatus]